MESLFISCLALFFTVLSFWWMHWRPGKLEVGNLQHFAAGSVRFGRTDAPNGWIVGLPLILMNTGASPLVLESLRLVPAKDNPAGKLIFNGVDTVLWTADSDEENVHDFLYLPKIIKPNDALAANVSFLWAPTDAQYQARLYHFFLEAKISGTRAWQKVKDIELNFAGSNDDTLYELSAFYKVYRYAPSA